MSMPPTPAVVQQLTNGLQGPASTERRPSVAPSEQPSATDVSFETGEDVEAVRLMAELMAELQMSAMRQAELQSQIDSIRVQQYFQRLES